MPKAQLVTRQETSGTNTENLNKASALTHAEMDKNLIGLRDSSWTIADDTSTTLNVTDDKTIYIQGSGTVSTALSGDTLTLTGSGISASSTDTLTNKTFDANGTGNSISNIETADIAAATLVTAAEGIGSNNNDTTLPTSAAVKAYADSVSGTITALNNQAENRLVSIGSTTTELDGEANLTFDGSTLAVTGNITATTSIANDAISLDDNKITATRSNDNLFISANGTGFVHIAGDDSNLFDSTLYSNLSGTPNRANSIIATVESVDAGSIAIRSYNSIISHNTTLTASGTDGDFRPRGIHASSNLDLDGFSYTNASTTRGPVAGSFFGQAENSGSGASTLATLRGLDAGAYIQDYSNHNQDITVDNAFGVRLSNGVENAGTGALTMTNVYGVYANAYTDNSGSGSATITNNYAFYTPGTGATNNYAFYSASDTAESRLGTIERYRETINSLTSSPTITVDCGLAPIHTVTLGTSTGFVISNLGTGQSVTIIITNGGSHTATFGTDGSTAVKFPGGAPTITASGTDVVTVFNDGTNYLGNIAQAYA